MSTLRCRLLEKVPGLLNQVHRGGVGKRWSQWACIEIEDAGGIIAAICHGKQGGGLPMVAHRGCEYVCPCKRHLEARDARFSLARLGQVAEVFASSRGVVVSLGEFTKP